MDKITYSSAGVDIDAADTALKRISQLAKNTFTHNVLTDIGLFAGAYNIGGRKILLSSADGVGTKIIVATMAGIYNTVGIDLVHHCANDIAVHNADPLFFLDYIGHSNLSVEKIAKIVEGLSAGCSDIRAPLIGGETAQMPSIYPPDEFDLVGFIVGIVERDDIILGNKITPGDAIIALPSNGLHTNGYSLARKTLFDIGKFSVDTYIDELGATTGDALLRTHTLYLNDVKKLREKIEIKGMAHITGGGVPGNLVRILPDDCTAIVKKSSAPKIPIFELIRRIGNIDDAEMFKTFNMGFGFLFVVASDDADNTKKILGEKAFIAGEIAHGDKSIEII